MQERVRKKLIYVNAVICYIMVFNGLIALNTGIGSINLLDDIIVAGLLLAIIAQVFIEKKIESNFIIFMLLTLLTVVISLLLNTPTKNVILGYLYMFKPFIIYFYFKSIRMNETEYKLYFKALEGLAFIVLIGGILDFIFFPGFRILMKNSILTDKHIGIIYPLQSFFTHPNICSWFMGFWAIYYFCKMMYYKKQKINLALFILYMMGALFTLRRKSILGIVVVILIYFYKSKSKNLKMYKFLTAAIIIALLIITKDNIILFFNEYKNVAAYKTGGGYNTRYLLMYIGSKIAIDKFPFGGGLGMFGGYASSIAYSSLYYDYGMAGLYGFSPETGFYSGDNYFGHIIGELGVIGFIIYLYITYRMYKKLREKWEMNYLTAFAYFIFIESIIELFGVCLYEISMPSFLIFGTLPLYKKSE